VHRFDTLAYLQTGTERQRRAYAVLTAHGVFDHLAAYQPILAGTIPLDIDIAGSDLDILCYCPQPESFREELVRQFGRCTGFVVREKQVRDRQTVIANFFLDEFPVELFGQNRPVREQEAYRHLITEEALLVKYGEPLRREVRLLKQQGIKTEPAFAQALGLPGDPYEALLQTPQP